MKNVRVVLKDFEQNIAKWLNNFPLLKSFIKYTRHQLVKPRYKLRVNPEFEFIDIFSENKNQIFFGYYTNRSINTTGLLLYNETKLTSKTIKSDDVIHLKCIDIESREITVIGKSSAWNWQQGCMLQWVSDKEKIVIYNEFDQESKSYKSIIHDVEEGRILNEVSIPYAAIDWDSKYILAINYERLSFYRSDYGYFTKNPIIEYDDNMDGIWRYNLEDETQELLVNICDLRDRMGIAGDTETSFWVNHLLFNPNFKSFIFLFRWRIEKKIYSVLFKYELESRKLKKVLDSEIISHYDWIDNDNIIVYLKLSGSPSGYYKLNTKTQKMNKVGEAFFYGDGHPRSYSKGVFITDSYPDSSRLAKLLYFDTKNNKGSEIGRFYQPLEFDAEYRCDLHPRVSIDAGYISFDSAHSGKRSQYLIKL